MRLVAALVFFLVAGAAVGSASGLFIQLYSNDDRAAFTARFEERMARQPTLYRPPQLFVDAITSPLDFAQPLETFSDSVVLDSATDGIALWESQFSLLPDCNVSRLVAPDSLEQAAQQVLETAVKVRDTQQSALAERDIRWLQKQFAKVQPSLAAPQPASLSRWERRRLRRFLQRLDKADLEQVACAGRGAAVLLDKGWLGAVQALMRVHPRADEDVLLQVEDPMGTVVFAGSASSSFQAENVLALFDLGGDDIYGFESADDFSAIPQWLVDLAGNDRYESTRPGGIGSAIGRVSLLLDRGGNDHYSGTTFTQAFALLGVSALIDEEGRDEYNARYHAQGAALAGAALLLDRAGNDRYRLEGLGQGLGLYAGLGAVADGSGNDVYRALAQQPTGYGTPGLSDAWAQGVGIGLRGLSSGGLGLVLDAAGADEYDAGVFAQGGGYYHGVGVVLDRGGNDRVTGSRYAQAWGAHGGLGLFDSAVGDDRYRSRHSVSAGLAWDYSLAWFRDRAGDDDYQVGAFSLGASAHASMALFEDAAGADDYRGPSPAQNAEGGPNLSLFLDRGSAANSFNGQVVSPGCRKPEDGGYVIWNLSTSEPACP